MHHAGHFYRSDNVVALRLRKVADSVLPSVADVLQRIGAEL
jgi:formylmethanofuran dehydrogenase subunit B